MGKSTPLLPSVLEEGGGYWRYRGHSTLNAEEFQGKKRQHLWHHRHLLGRLPLKEAISSTAMHRWIVICFLGSGYLFFMKAGPWGLELVGPQREKNVTLVVTKAHFSNKNLQRTAEIALYGHPQLYYFLLVLSTNIAFINSLSTLLPSNLFLNVL